jgi:outer membrane protein OmpA-like peptidoglycan-associated protein
MVENILELLKNQLTGPVVGQIAQSLGLPEGKARSALEGAIATILSGLLQRTSRPGGAESLLSTLREGGHGGDLLDNLGSALATPDGTQNLMTTGHTLLGSIFGDKLGNVANALSGGLGLSKGVANSLLALAAPLVMGQLGKLVASQGLGLSGLVELLSGQKKFLQSAAPPGLSGALGLNSLADLGKDVQARAADYGASAARAGRAAVDAGTSWLRWALPLGLIAALALLALYFMRPNQPVNPADRQVVADRAAENARGTVAGAAERTKAAAENVRESIAGAAEGARGAVANAAEEIKSSAEGIKEKLAAVTLPGGLTIDLPENSGLHHFATFLQNPKPDSPRTFALNLIHYDPGTTQVSAASLASIDILARILKAVPSVNIKLVGHPDTATDSTRRRDEALRRATDAKGLLVQRGVNADRIEVEGAETEAKDARLVLVVTKI